MKPSRVQPQPAEMTARNLNLALDFVIYRNPNGEEELPLIPQNNLSLRSADVSGPHLPEASKLRVKGVKETFRAPSEGGILVLTALLPCMLPSLSDTPTFHGPLPCSSMQQCTFMQTPPTASAKMVIWAAAGTPKFLSIGSEKEQESPMSCFPQWP